VVSEPPGPSTARYLTKAQFAAESIRERIRRGDLRPGVRLDLDALSSQLGMSATPIREALRSLEAQGLVVNSPHRGIHVTEFSSTDAAELYDLRAHLESYATTLAAPVLTDSELEQLRSLASSHREALDRGDIVAMDRHNEEWHFLIYRASRLRTPHLIEFISRLWNAFPWTTAWMVRGRGSTSVQEHEWIMDALERHHGDVAGQLMARHVLAGKRLVIEYLAEGDGLEPERFEPTAGA
jgi:DNA-binding GntR family transcriptional regulator